MRLITLSKAEQNRAPAWFMLVALLALLWNGAGVAQFVQYISMTPNIVALLPPERQALYYSTPAWADAAFGLAVITGAIGSLLLIMRRRTSVAFFGLSLAGVVVQQLHAVVLARSAQLLGATSLILPALVLFVAVLLLLLSFKARMRGWTS